MLSVAGEEHPATAKNSCHGVEKLPLNARITVAGDNTLQRRGYQVEICNSRVGKGISAQASHRTVLETLTSHGSSHSVIIKNQLLYWTKLNRPTFRWLLFLVQTNELNPSLHSHYRNFITTMIQSDAP